MTETVTKIIGPFFSHWGFKNWLLHLYPEQIEAEPLGIRLSLKAGIYAGLGQPYSMNGVYSPANSLSAPGARLSSEMFRASDLLKIVVRHQLFTANEIRIYWKSGKKLVMGIGFRQATDSTRASLKATYPELYQEQRFGA